MSIFCSWRLVSAQQFLYVHKHQPIPVQRGTQPIIRLLLREILLSEGAQDVPIPHTLPSPQPQCQ